MKGHKIPVQLNVIYFALIAACTVITLVIQLDLGRIASSSLTRFDRPFFGFLPFNLVPVILFSAVIFFFNKVFFPSSLPKSPEVLEEIQKLKTGEIKELSGAVYDGAAVQMILTWAMCEAITIFGMTSYFFEPTESWKILINYSISLAWLFYYSPKRMLNNYIEN